MVFITPFLGAAALLSGMASALPRPAGNGVLVNSQSTTASAALATDASSSSPATSGSSTGNGVVVASQSTSASAAVATNASNNGYGTAATYGSSSDSSYGSSASYGSSECLAQYGSPDSAYMPTSTSGSEGSTGTGATHTIIVAPSQGVLRYVPFAVNASMGDTVKFVWGANTHTVTKSSELTPCNKTSDALFASGTHDKGFVFTQVVNDTNPIYFYCGTPNHCQQGMFGIINPPNAFGAATSVSASMQSIGTSNPDVAAYASYTSNKTTNSLAASKWGGSIDLSALPVWAQAAAAENVLYTRNFLASNPEVLKEDGSVDLSSAAATPLMIPQDVGADLNNAAVVSAPSTETSAVTSGTATTSEAAASTSAAAIGNGASSLASPKAFVALFVLVATFLSL
ncbi:hypothetical protein C0995_001971 [Termitomyces sp. Mi166|nr:hypothetical protein C0995_001971 [Termitomyces sp. Mi166\